jgi:hypothetical protein
VHAWLLDLHRQVSLGERKRKKRRKERKEKLVPLWFLR